MCEKGVPNEYINAPAIANGLFTVFLNKTNQGGPVGSRSSLL